MKNAGFTLIELMVSLTVFSIVMLISVGTLLTLIDANAKAQALYMATTNLSFALDMMTRDIRIGHYYRCENLNEGNHYGNDLFSDQTAKNNCSSGNSEKALIFTRDWSGVRVGYRLRNEQIEQRVSPSTTWVPLTTSNSVRVTKLDFVVENSATGGGQPTIGINIQGEVPDGIEDESTTDFDIQTQIISRRLDII